MAKVHPTAAAAALARSRSELPPETNTNKPAARTLSLTLPTTTTTNSDNNEPVVLTVWKKSLLFNCSGFTVFDSKGNLVYRVDNYAAGSKSEIVLMDASGSPLLTIRRKRLSLGEKWLVYEGDAAVNPLFSATKHIQLLYSSDKNNLAHISFGDNKMRSTVVQVQGSYQQRRCVAYEQSSNRTVAEIKRKEAPAGRGGAADFGVDVFRLVVQPDVNPQVGMAIVILLDQMFQSSSTRRRRFSF